MRIIGFLSSKGGVGKTTIVTNLSCMLAKLGYDVIAVDANLTTPHLGTHLGYSLASNTLHMVLKDQISLKEAIHIYPLGFKFIPGSINLEDLKDLDAEKLSETLKILNSDFLLIDCAPGLGREAMVGLRSSEEVIIVTNPELPCIIDAMRTIKMAEMLGKKIVGVILNRIRGKLNLEKIESFFEKNIIAKIPEDPNISKSIAEKIPLVNAYKNSPAAVEISKLAYKIAGLPFYEEKLSLIEKIAKWLFK